MPNEDVSPSASLRKESFFISVREKTLGFQGRKEEQKKHEQKIRKKVDRSSEYIVLQKLVKLHIFQKM